MKPLAVVLGCEPGEVDGVRTLVLRACAEARARDWPFLSDVLRPLLRGVSEPAGAIVHAAVQAMAKYDRLLAFACGARDAPMEARLDMLVGLAAGHAREVGERIARIDRLHERLAIAYSFPDWVVEVLAGEIGDAALEAALSRMNTLAPRVARVNTLSTTREACLAALEQEGVHAHPTAHAAAGVVLEGRRSVFRTRAFADGHLELQDEASQLVAELVAPPPRSLVVDACAGAGGKTLALAALLAGKGKVLALDSSEPRLVELRRRARRAKASNVWAIGVDLLAPGDALTPFRGAAARVLVDAPCSGLGAIRRNPEARWRLRRDDLARLTAAQEALLEAALPLVAPRGRLVYATCSFLPSEGQAAVERLLVKHPALSWVTPKDVLGRAKGDAVSSVDGRALQTWRFDAADPTDSGAAAQAEASATLSTAHRVAERGGDGGLWEGAAPSLAPEGAPAAARPGEPTADPACEGAPSPTCGMDGFFAAVLRARVAKGA